MRGLLIAAVAAAAAGCSVDRNTAAESVAEIRRTVALERHDSLVAVAIASLDSPEISMEWLDSPRRRITARARRVRVATARTAISATDSSATAATAAVSSEHTGRRTGPALPGWWVVAAGVALMLVLSWRGTCARR